MKITKGDILYQYFALDISDKDYCNENLDKKYNKSCKDNDNNYCGNYNKCNFRAKKSELEKVKITKIVKMGSNIWSYRYVRMDIKDYKPRGVIYYSNINSWSKSEQAALRKHNTDLKEFIKKVKKSSPGDFGYFKKEELKTYESLQKRVQGKVDKLKIKTN